MARHPPKPPPTEPVMPSRNLTPFPDRPLRIEDTDDGRKCIVFPGVTVTVPARFVQLYLDADEQARKEWVKQRRKALSP